MEEKKRIIINNEEYSKNYSNFLLLYPKYKETIEIDNLRAKEYARLDEHNHIYVDYSGSGLYSITQIEEHFNLLKQMVFGNPHSTNPTSLISSNFEDNARNSILNYFNTNSEEYDVIFCANATAGLKLLGESYIFGSNVKFLLTSDNHNSVNGIREFAKKKGSKVKYIPLIPENLRINEKKLLKYLSKKNNKKKGLFAFPAQSNATGVQHPLEWIKIAQGYGWDVLLDASAYIPTNKLDLNYWKPNFLCISFYKIFGYPTGVGALLVKRTSFNRLKRPWFGGGTVAVVSVVVGEHVLQDFHTGFEDGTINFLNLPAIQIGLNYIGKYIDLINIRVKALTSWFIEKLQELYHKESNSPLAVIYGPKDSQLRGGTIMFNLFDHQKVWIPHTIIEKQANLYQISLRTGCFCNPGAAEAALKFTKLSLFKCFAFSKRNNRRAVADFLECYPYPEYETGMVRISFGLVSNFRDVIQLIEFFKLFLDKDRVKEWRTDYERTFIPPKSLC